MRVRMSDGQARAARFFRCKPCECQGAVAVDEARRLLAETEPETDGLTGIWPLSINVPGGGALAETLAAFVEGE